MAYIRLRRRSESWRKPQNPELKSFLELIRHYWKFLPNLSTTLAPFYNLLHLSTKWRRTVAQKQASKASKSLLNSSRVLVHLDPSNDLMAGIASPYGVGAVLSHRYPDGTEKPFGYASRALTAAKKKYAQIEKEGLACIFRVKRFHQYIYGHHFTLVTNHKPLPGLFSENRAVPAQASARILQ